MAALFKGSENGSAEGSQIGNPAPRVVRLDMTGPTNRKQTQRSKRDRFVVEAADSSLDEDDDFH